MILPGSAGCDSFFFFNGTVLWHAAAAPKTERGCLTAAELATLRAYEAGSVACTIAGQRKLLGLSVTAPLLSPRAQTTNVIALKVIAHTIRPCCVVA
jgi:hypothetical protein